MFYRRVHERWPPTRVLNGQLAVSLVDFSSRQVNIASADDRICSTGNLDGDVHGWRCERSATQLRATPEPSTLYTGSAWMEAGKFQALRGLRYGDYSYMSERGAHRRAPRLEKLPLKMKVVSDGWTRAQDVLFMAQQNLSRWTDTAGPAPGSRRSGQTP